MFKQNKITAALSAVFGFRSKLSAVCASPLENFATSGLVVRMGSRILRNGLDYIVDGDVITVLKGSFDLETDTVQRVFDISCSYTA